MKIRRKNIPKRENKGHKGFQDSSKLVFLKGMLNETQWMNGRRAV